MMLHHRCQRRIPDRLDRLPCKGFCNGRCRPQRSLVIVRAEAPRLRTVLRHDVIAYADSWPVEIAMIQKSRAGGRELRQEASLRSSRHAVSADHRSATGAPAVGCDRKQVWILANIYFAPGDVPCG